MPLELIRPGEKQDYTCDWATFLAGTGSPTDTIASTSWTISPQEGSPIQPILSDESNTATTATIWVDDCVWGEIYTLTNTITTAAGREHVRKITLRCGP